MLVPLDVEVYEVLPVVDALTRDLCRHDALVDMDHLAGLVLSHDLAELSAGLVARRRLVTADKS